MAKISAAESFANQVEITLGVKASKELKNLEKGKLGTRAIVREFIGFLPGVVEAIKTGKFHSQFERDCSKLDKKVVSKLSEEVKSNLETVKKEGVEGLKIDIRRREAVQSEIIDRFASILKEVSNKGSKGLRALSNHLDELTKTNNDAIRADQTAIISRAEFVPEKELPEVGRRRVPETLKSQIELQKGIRKPRQEPGRLAEIPTAVGELGKEQYWTGKKELMGAVKALVSFVQEARAKHYNIEKYMDQASLKEYEDLRDTDLRAMSPDELHQIVRGFAQDIHQAYLKSPVGREKSDLNQLFEALPSKVKDMALPQDLTKPMEAPGYKGGPTIEERRRRDEAETREWETPMAGGVSGREYMKAQRERREVLRNTLSEFVTKVVDSLMERFAADDRRTLSGLRGKDLSKMSDEEVRKTIRQVLDIVKPDNIANDKTIDAEIRLDLFTIGTELERL